MRYAILALFALAMSVSAAPISVKFVSDVLHPDQAEDLDMGFRILLTMRTQLELSQQLNAELIPASRLREWRELTTQPDVCLYNKVKTPERLKYAEFTSHPIVAFPPNRLVTHLGKNLPDRVSLQQLVDNKRFNIGVVEGRAYGNAIDNWLAQNTQKVTWISGKDAAKRLRMMFARGKFDAVIEYSATFMAEPEIDTNKLSFHQLIESNEMVFGYIACARSDQGKAVIGMFNELMRDVSVQKMIVDSHYAEFFGQESRYVRDAISAELTKP